MRVAISVGFVVVAGLLLYGLISIFQSDDSRETDNSNGRDSPVETAEPEPESTNSAPVDNSSGTHLESDRCVSGLSDRETALTGRTIIVDPGHGGEDLGTVNSTFGLTESELVLPISERVRDRLVESGANVCLTRIDDTYIGLGDRTRFANDQGGDAFVSVHLNSLPDPSENYVMTMWGTEAKDRFLAENMLDSLRFEMSTPAYNGGVPNPIDPDVYLLQGLDSNMLSGARMPAVLVEASFLSNDWEAQAFVDGINDGTHWRERQVARAIHEGLLNYFEAIE